MQIHIRHRFVPSFVMLFGLAAPLLLAQSTQSTILGTVKDATGALIPKAEVVVINVDKGISSSYRTDASGNYQAPELIPGAYKVQVTKEGFESQLIEGIQLTARQQLRVDVILSIGVARQEVTVNADTSGAIETETSSVSASLNTQDVSNLPVNYYGTGGTSPLNALQTLPGVQSDTASGTASPTANGTSGSSFSVQGGQPFQTEVSVDGISTQNVRYNSPLSDAFPSAESIAEIRVDGVSNNAEFGQVGEITTITKSGANQYHGAGFWHFQNRVLDATPFGQTVKPKKIGNDFGISVGGPATIPHLYNGRNRTFFFSTYEGFQFPKQSPIHDLVPTALMQSGDFSQEFTSDPLIDPATGSPYAGNIITSINPSAKPFLSFFPTQNYPAAAPYATLEEAENGDGYNYSENRDSKYNSNQFDARIDHHFNQKLQAFGRYTYKNVTQLAPQDLNVASVTDFDNYRILASSLLYNFTPNLLNEFRFGFTSERNGMRNVLDGKSYTDAAGFDPVGSGYSADGMTVIDFPASLTSLYAGNVNSTTGSHLIQYNENLIWIKGRHTMKYGGDIRSMKSTSTLGSPDITNVEGFAFAGLYTSAFDTYPQTAGVPSLAYQFADYLAGAPYETEYYTLVSQNQGVSTYYAFFGQDQWRIRPNLTLSYGLRYEYHPAFHDTQGDIGNFDPSVATTGAVIYPDGNASKLDASYLANFDACGYGPASTAYAACTPVLSNSQAGLPNSLRKTQKDRFLPRIGLAWLPFNNDKTAVRAGFGVYNTTLTGSIYFLMTNTLQAARLDYFNSYNYPPAYTWPETSVSSAQEYGTASFDSANKIDWKDPYSMQWNLSIDHEFLGDTGVRISYIGMRTDDLVWAPNENDMSYSSTTVAASRPLTDRPFPNWGEISDSLTGAQASYHALQLEANHRFQHGLTFQSTYTWAKNLADNQGPDSTSFALDTGSSGSLSNSGVSTYRYDRSLDYGNIYGTRHQRWISTGVYELPFGTGRKFGTNMHPLENTLVGGWQLSGIFLLQTGPYITAYIPASDADPSGTGSGSLYGRVQHPDVIGKIKPDHQNRNQWVNKSAFACPSNSGYTSASYAGNACSVGVTSNPIGRFGNESVGKIVGPGTVNLSLGINKRFAITDNLHLRAEGTFTNVLNHTNLNDPILDITSQSFGKITSARGSDFGGSRTGQVSMKVEF